MSSAAAVAREGIAHHDHLLALFSSSPSRTRTARTGTMPPNVPPNAPRAPFAGIDLAREAVIEGRVVGGAGAVAGACVRLLDVTGAFVAEVPTGGDGAFRFFAEPGPWTVRVAVGDDVVHASVEAVRGSVAGVDVAV
jgi:hypothetical protein